MPTIFIINGKLRVVIFTHDHLPPHIHVIGPDREAKFLIKDLSVIENIGFKGKEIKLIQKFLETRHELIKEKWENIHGEN